MNRRRTREMYATLRSSLQEESQQGPQGATTPEEPIPAAPGNSFAALAPTDQGEPAETDEEDQTLQVMLERLVQHRTSPPPRRLHHLRVQLGIVRACGGHPRRAEHPPSQRSGPCRDGGLSKKVYARRYHAASVGLEAGAAWQQENRGLAFRQEDRRFERSTVPAAESRRCFRTRAESSNSRHAYPTTVE